MWYRAGADLVMLVHLLFIIFVVGGAYLAWKWPRIVWAHLPAAVYGAMVEFIGFTCPLTLLENDLRHLAGDAGYGGGFVSHYLINLIYPSGLTRGMHIALGLLVLVSAVVGYWGFLRRYGLRLVRSSPPQSPLVLAPVDPSPSTPHQPVPGRRVTR